MKNITISGKKFSITSHKVYFRKIHIGHDSEDIKVLLSIAAMIDRLLPNK